MQKNQMKITEIYISIIKNSVNERNCRMEMIIERLSELKDR